MATKKTVPQATPTQAAKKQAPAAKAPAAKASAPAKPKKPTAAASRPESREESIRLAAYYLAERDGFQRPPQEYWTEALASLNGSEKKKTAR